MITGTMPYEGAVEVVVGGFTVTSNFVSGNARRGGNMMPYRCTSDIGQATVNLYYDYGVAIPAMNTGTYLFIATRGTDGSLGEIFSGTVADIRQTAVLDQATGKYGTQITIYAYDRIAELSLISVPGVITSSTTKNQTWEQRLTTTLGPYFPASSVILPSTSTEAHIYRLVDNNIDGSLVDQINLACNSVGATWNVAMSKPNSNKVRFFAKGVYDTTGVLFTDELGYWTSSNKPAKAGTIFGYNMTYKTVEMSFDTTNIVNSLSVKNIMPRNVILRVSDGTLLYKDPATTRVDALETIEPTYVAENATSVSTYGRRPAELQTNLYPFRTTDTENFYLRFNSYEDPGIDYRSEPQVSCTNANVRFSSVTPEFGTYCLDVVTTASGSSYQLILGDPNGYLLKVLPVANVNPYTVSWRTSQANARFTRGIQYLDSNGNVLLTQSSVVSTPTLNTWISLGAVYMDYTAIPAGTVAWRPIVTITHATGTFSVGTTIAKLDTIAINPQMQYTGFVSGDTADTTAFVNGWEGQPGQSWSYTQRNILDNIGTDALDYLKDGGLAPSYLEWNARQNWDIVSRFQPGNRVDIRFQGTNYAAWIDALEWDISAENAILKLELSRRPASWN